MRHTNRFGVAIAVAGLILIAGGFVALAADNSAVLKQRQDFMKAQGADLKPIQAYIKGDGAQAAALAAAEDLAARSPKIVALFPPGTSSADFPGKTAAKPEIWQNMDKFKAIPVVLHGEEVKLVAAIKSGDKAAAGAALAAAGKSGCSTCHGAFREKTS
jgi:cytochrome c556